jgi:phage major head subunit gpT-like protein
MIINAENLLALNTNYTAAFTEGMNGAVSTAPEALKRGEIDMTVPSTGPQMEHHWLSSIPAMGEWIGERKIKNLVSGKLLVLNKDFESTVKVPRNAIEDDQYGQFALSMRIMGANAAALPLKLVTDALVANGTWADGAAFFGTTRTYGSNTITNLVTGALDATTLATAIQVMTSYLGANDEPLNVTPRYLICGPKLRKTAWDLVKNSLVSSGTGKGGSIQNDLQGIVELRVSPRLVGTQDDYWYLVGEQAGIKGVGYQDRVSPVMETSDLELFTRNEYQWGARARGAAFLTLPHLVYAAQVS